MDSPIFSTHLELGTIWSASKIAQKNNLTLLPEIHAEYGLHLHDEVADKGYAIYDFFLPGLMIHTLENSNSTALISWAKEIVRKRLQNGQYARVS